MHDLQEHSIVKLVGIEKAFSSELSLEFAEYVILLYAEMTWMAR